MQGKNRLPKQKIIVIVGPTASGKTSLSVSLAQALRGEIISADSRQVYTALNIGTEKITKEEMAGIPHHLIDCTSPLTTYTASDFVHDASQTLAEIQARGTTPFIVGGTFFYIEALLGIKQIPLVPPNPSLRRELESLSTEELYQRLQTQDPIRARTIDAQNPRRLIRALEILSVHSTVPPFTPHDTPYDAYIVGLSLPPPLLRQRITQRLHETLGKGLVTETQTLLAQGIPEARLREIGLEYRVVLDALSGTIPFSALETTLVQKVWQYAKRQNTWLKKMQHVHWYAPEERERIHEDIKAFLA